MRRALWCVATLILVLAPGTSAQKAPAKQDRKKSEDEIVAAVVRYNTLAQRGVVFLSIAGRDPSPEVLHLLSVWYVRVLPASRAVYVSVPNQAGLWKDKKSGDFGRYFEAYIEKRVSDTRAEVSAGWGQPCGTYVVVLLGGVWSVESYKPWELCF